MPFPSKFKHLLELTWNDVPRPDEIWLAYAVCACESESCQWEGWIIEAVKKEGKNLPADTDQKCCVCGRDLFRTWVALRCAPTENQKRDLIEGIDYEVVPMEYDSDTE